MNVRGFTRARAIRIIDTASVRREISVDDVFLLWHVHETGDGQEDEKLIGVYRTRDDAAAIQRVGAPDLPVWVE